MTEPQATRPVGSSPTRPPDVDTGFWLWAIALPLMVTGYIIDVLTEEQRPTVLVVAINVIFVAVLASLVVTFMILMRHGYRWARTCLTGGAIAGVVYSSANLFAVERHPAAAMGYAASVIIGSVLVIGGMFLLHRKDAHEFFSR